MDHDTRVAPASGERDDQSPPPARRYLPWLAGLAALAAIIVLVATATLRQALKTRVPDLKAFVASSRLRNLDRQSRAALPQQFAAIRRGAPWLAYEAQGIADYCELASQESQVVLSPATWSADCQREQTLYFAFGGSLAARLGQLQHVLSERGWTNVTPAPGTSLQQSGAPSSGSSLAADGPVVTLGPGAGDTIALPGQISMEVGWARSGGSLAPVRILNSDAAMSRAATPFYRPLELRPADVAAVAGRASGTDRYLVGVQISVRYYVSGGPSSWPSGGGS